MKAVRNIIFWYTVLLVLEGVLRKWIFPKLSLELFLLRDPLVFAAYFLAYKHGLRRFVPMLFICSGLSCLAILTGLIAHANIAVLLFGVRTDFLTIPFIWVIGEAMDGELYIKLVKFLLIASIPMAILMVAQYQASPDAMINTVAGGEGVGQDGVFGKIRPSGFFAAPTGPSYYIPLVAAMAFACLTDGLKRVPKTVLYGAIFACFICTSVSINRTLLLGLLIVLCTYIFLNFAKGLVNPKMIAMSLGVAAVLVMAGYLPTVRDGAQAMTERFHEADASEGDVFDRLTYVFGGAFNELHTTQMVGEGAGMTTNAANYYLGKSLGFGDAEYEWDRAIVELGPVLGICYIAARIGLMVYMGYLAARASKMGILMGVLVFSTAWHNFLTGQLPPPTILGFFTISGGLIVYADEEAGRIANERSNALQDHMKRLRARWGKSKQLEAS